MKYTYISAILIVAFLLVLSTVTNALSAAPAMEKEADYVPGKIMIRLEPNSMPFAEIETSFKQIDKRLISIEDHYKINSEKTDKKGISRELYILEFPKNLDMKKIAEKYKKLPYVRIAEPVYIGYGTMMPNDPNFTLQWGLHNTGQAGGTIDADIDAPEAWNITQGSSAVIIAVIDSGVDFSHPDLDSKLLPGFNLLSPENLPEDDYGHGTSVTGIIAAETNNDEGIASVCPNCMILPLKAINSDGIIWPYDAADAILYAVGDPDSPYGQNPTPADIISMSFKFDYDTQDIRDAVEYAYYNFGATLVAAAGNQNGITPRYPAAYSEVISVGAINRYNTRWTSQTYGSNYGPWVDIAAPGMEIWTTNLGTPDYVSTAGTSISTPFVSGIAGLLLSYDPALTNAEIADILNKTGDPTTGFTPAIKRVNAFQALSSISVDVQLGNVYYDPDIQLGQQTTLFFTIKNTGPINLENVQYKIDAGAPGIAFNGDHTFVPSGGIMTYTISSIDAGETVGIYITWVYTGEGTYNGSVDVDSDEQYFEINEGNNDNLFTINVSGQS